MDKGECEGLLNQIHGIVKNDRSIVWGRISQVETDTIHVISSRNSIERILLSDIKEIL
jgi:hypothetical protein